MYGSGAACVTYGLSSHTIHGKLLMQDIQTKCMQHFVVFHVVPRPCNMKQPPVGMLQIHIFGVSTISVITLYLSIIFGTYKYLALLLTRFAHHHLGSQWLYYVSIIITLLHDAFTWCDIRWGLYIVSEPTHMRRTISWERNVDILEPRAIHCICSMLKSFMLCETGDNPRFEMWGLRRHSTMHLICTRLYVRTRWCCS